MRIALDAMGGDYAPGPIVAGAVQAAIELPELVVHLVGQEEKIIAELNRLAESGISVPLDRLPVVHAAEVVGMEDKPVEALRSKRVNSIAKTWGLMATGQAEAVVSAGNTGAMVASGLFNAKMFLPGVRRPGIAAFFPSSQGPVVLIDVGANMAPKPEDLYQYGLMGAVYAEKILGVTDPKIGLLNVGAEDDKGNDLVRATRELFMNSPHASRFCGNVEGRDIYEGHARVVVTEGFTGNILLKGGEGAVEFLFAALKEWMARLLVELPPESAKKVAEGLGSVKRRYEYKEFGGAPLLGIRGACIICHGSSDDRAIRNAIRVAANIGKSGVNDEIVKMIAQTAPGGEG
ncbi:MAG: phosphate acyltransferase PlsX [bacterium]